jgi:hypothetical protein
VVVGITDPGTASFSGESGFYVQPATEARLAFSLRTISRKESPYPSACWQTWKSTKYQPMFTSPDQAAHTNITTYSYEVCKPIP